MQKTIGLLFFHKTLKICASVPVDKKLGFKKICTKYKLLYWFLREKLKAR